MSSETGEVTRLLQAWGDGDQAALERLTPLVYEELRRTARRYMKREGPGNSLQTTALVHEAYLRLVDAAGVRWQDRAHFLAVSAQIMRRILVDAARARGAGKRGGQVARVDVNESIDAIAGRSQAIIALDDALEALVRHDKRKAQVVEMRFFGGLSVDEMAAVLKISPQSVMRDWKLAREWLVREMGG